MIFPYHINFTTINQDVDTNACAAETNSGGSSQNCSCVLDANDTMDMVDFKLYI